MESVAAPALVLSVCGIALTFFQALHHKEPQRQNTKPLSTPKKITIIQDGSKYAHNVGGYYRFGEVLDNNVSLAVVEAGTHYLNDMWFLKARNGSSGHLTPDKVRVLTPDARDKYIEDLLDQGIFVGVLENVVSKEGEEPVLPVTLHSKEFSDIINSHTELVFIVGHESSGVSEKVLNNKRLCPLTIETHGTSKKDSSLGVATVVCTLLNQIRNYTRHPI